MANEGRLRRLSITVLSVLTLTFCGVQLWGVTDAPAAVPTTTGPAPTDEEANGVREQSAASITLAFAGDVNFSERTADRLAANPATAFGAAAEGLAAADLTVVNLAVVGGVVVGH